MTSEKEKWTEIAARLESEYGRRKDYPWSPESREKWAEIVEARDRAGEFDGRRAKILRRRFATEETARKWAFKKNAGPQKLASAYRFVYFYLVKFDGIVNAWRVERTRG